MEEKQLEKLGLLESESKVYLTLLKEGQNPVGKIAKQTSLNRGSVYKALETLMKKGFVAHVIKANTKEYKASSPEVVEKLIKEKEKELQKIKEQIPSLKKLFGSTKTEIETNIYEGIKGAKAIWENLLDKCKKNDVWLIIGAPKSAEIFGGYFKYFNEMRAKKKIGLKIIYNQEAKSLINVRKKQPLTKVKAMPKKYITPSSIEIVNDNVLIVLYFPQIIIFHIKNTEIAKSFKVYFDMLWNVGKSVNQKHL